MKRTHVFLLSVLLLAGCSGKDSQSGKDSTEDPALAADKKISLPEARSGFKTMHVGAAPAKRPVPRPPANLFHTVRYESPTGKLSAYLSPEPRDGKLHPAIIWITGGDCNSIDEGCWKKGPPNNDQSASAFREAGILMMFPSLRGGNDNPGFKEGFFGEVDDVIAAADFLAAQEFIDPRRIYLGGHSTGGTLVMLVAASSDRFRAVFSFGPADDISGYQPEYTPFNTANRREFELRSPGRWLHSIQVPLFVFEGTVKSNLAALQTMAQASTNPKAHFFQVQGADHFSILAPTTRLIAEKILRDDGTTTNLAFSEDELKQAHRK